MRAMAIDRYGEPEVLRPRDLPEPAPGDFDLLLEVHAAALNPVDTKIRQDGLGAPREFPLVLGYDVSGVVRGVGAKVEGFKVGDEVYASPALNRNGSNAELVCVDSRAAALKPRSLDHVYAAALPLVTLTAWEALHDKAHIQAGQTVLIHAGGGGVGHIAVQLARLTGCHVLSTASQDESIELTHDCGAEVVINYRQEDFVQRVQRETAGRGCDVVFDTVGGEVFNRSMECVGVVGQMITILPNDTSQVAQRLFMKSASLHMEFMGAATIFNVRPERQGQILRAAAVMVDEGRLKPHISRTIALEEIAEGHRQQESGHTVGKIAVRVRE